MKNTCQEAIRMIEKWDRQHQKRPKTVIRLKRMAMGLYQWELAEMIGVTSAAVSRWETHGVTAPRTAKRLAVFFHCDWKELIDDPAPARTGANQ